MNKRNNVTIHVWDASRVAHESVPSLWGAEIKIGGTTAKIDNEHLLRVDFRNENSAKKWAAKVAHHLRNLIDSLEE